MNQSQVRAITFNWLKAREKGRVLGAIGFGFASHWLKNWRASFKPITKCSDRNHVITFDSHLKTALIKLNLLPLNYWLESFDLVFFFKCLHGHVDLTCSFKDARKGF